MNEICQNLTFRSQLGDTRNHKNASYQYGSIGQIFFAAASYKINVAHKPSVIILKIWCNMPKD